MNIPFFHRLLRRRSNYRAAFESVPGRQVLADLKRFCGDSPVVVSPITRTVDTHATAIRIGRREVLDRILQHLSLDDAALARLQEEATND